MYMVSEYNQPKSYRKGRCGGLGLFYITKIKERGRESHRERERERERYLQVELMKVKVSKIA